MKNIYLIICLMFNSVFVFSQWTALSSGTTNHLHSIFFPEPNTGFIAGINGTILKTINGGSEWITLSCGTTNHLNSVYFHDANTGYAVGDAGTIIKTSNGGTTWTTLLSGTTSTLYSVYFTSSNTGYAAGGNGVYKTIDGGTSWTISISGAFLSVYFPEIITGYAVGFNSKIIKTIDGGTTWTTLYSKVNDILTSVYFFNASTGYVVGHEDLNNLAIILHTSDGGTTWTRDYDYKNNYLYSISFPDNRTGYMVGDQTILKTINAGSTWIPLSSGTGSGFNSVYFTDVNTGYVVGGFGKILKTTVGGLILEVTPDKRIVSSNAGYTNFVITCNTNWYIACDASWCTLTPWGSGNSDITASYTENTTVSPRIAKITVHADGLDSVAVTVTQSRSNIGIENIKKDDFQIYPNPTEGFIKISSYCINKEPVEVRVHDINGRDIFKKQFQGENEYKIDLSSAKQGCYSIILKSDDQILVRKVVIIN